VKTEKNIKPIEIEKATYVSDFRVCIDFNDGKSNIVDFKPFLETMQNRLLEKYKDLEAFRKFKIENGNLVWGKNWDLIFPVTQLYKGMVRL
jgi:ribosomal protein S4E